jgi:hypothetical protein
MVTLGDTRDSAARGAEVGGFGGGHMGGFGGGHFGGGGHFH